MLGKKKAGDNVAVVGGGLIGCETALWLAQQGKNVTILEILPELMVGGMPVPLMNRMMLEDLLTLNKVDVVTAAHIQEITDEGIRVKYTNGNLEETINADSVVIATGLKSNADLYQALIGRFPQLYAIGDCREARNIMGAIWDGFEVGRTI
jgi:2-enoate reductase